VSASYLREDFSQGIPKAGIFQWAWQIAQKAQPGDVYRSKEGRKTLRFDKEGQSFFLKIHSGVGWSEILKNLAQARLPVLSARNEYEAVAALNCLGVDTMSVVAYSCEGLNPATVKSVIVTEDLVGTVSLEDYCADWANNPPTYSTRLKLLRKLADSARRMHGAGINHRDFYICHFHLDERSLDADEVSCYLIDLHRAQIRKKTPRRWLLKDLGGLYFSAMDCGLKHRDLLRFMRHYSDKGLRGALGADLSFWLQVAKNAENLYRKEYGVDAPQIVSIGAKL
jgi:heptose I phosphotransferase